MPSRRTRPVTARLTPDLIEGVQRFGRRVGLERSGALRQIVEEWWVLSSFPALNFADRPSGRTMVDRMSGLAVVLPDGSIGLVSQAARTAAEQLRETAPEWWTRATISAAKTALAAQAQADAAALASPPPLDEAPLTPHGEDALARPPVTAVERQDWDALDTAV